MWGTRVCVCAHEHELGGRLPGKVREERGDNTVE